MRSTPTRRSNRVRHQWAIRKDTNVNGHPSSPKHGPGPWEAVQRFLASNPDFERDTACERHLLTFFPSGWLKRVGVGKR